MPIIDGMGQSSATPDKQEALKEIFAYHMGITNNVFDNWKDKSWFNLTYHYIDLNCGSGYNQNENEDGSPILFLRAISRFDMKYKAWFIDESFGNCNDLQSKIPDNENIEIILGDNKEKAPEIINNIGKYAYGLVYNDPNTLPDFNLLYSIAKKSRYLDILVRCTTTTVKRVNKRHGTTSLYEFIDKMRGCGKEFIMVHEPFRNTHIWTTIYFSCYQSRDWKNCGWFSATSKEGKELLYEFEWTKKERNIIEQPQLFESIYNTMKKKIVDRSGGICELCEKRKATEIHHIRYGTKSIKDRLHVCHECHCKIEGKDS